MKNQENSSAAPRRGRPKGGGRAPRIPLARRGAADYAVAIFDADATVATLSAAANDFEDVPTVTAWLNDAADHLRAGALNEPPPSDVKSWAHAVATRAGALVDLFEQPTIEEGAERAESVMRRHPLTFVNARISPPFATELIAALEAVQDLQVKARLVADEASRRCTAARSTAAADRAFWRCVAGAFEAGFGRAAGYSTEPYGSMRGGPAIRFARAALEHIHRSGLFDVDQLRQLSDDAIGRRLTQSRARTSN